MDKIIIETCGLTKVFPGRITAVDDVCFTVKEGEIFGFLGPNGAGKSTTIAMLTTLISPTKGHAIVAGYEILKYPYKVRSSIGYVSQDLAVDDALTGKANLRIQAGFYHIPSAEISGRIDEVLSMVELKDRTKDKVETYSGGMRKRLDIACGLIHRPRLLFLDEPTLGLDIQTRREIWKYINRLRAETGMTIFLTTHYMDEADSLCDRVAIIDIGKIKILDQPANLKTSLGNELVEFQFSPIELSEIDSALSKIRELGFVKSVSEAGDRGYIASVDNGEASIPAMFEALKDSSAKISRILYKQPSLDDVFLHYTGREMREAGGGKENAVRNRIMMRRVRK